MARDSDIAVDHGDLSKELASFFKYLYSFLDVAPLRDKIGQIVDHYQAFVKTNSTGKCPFCGIGDIKGLHHSKRDAYDHYLPKVLYPFNSINFRNLAPACHDCNSTYKHSKDPAHGDAGRRKALYPYAVANHNIELRVNLKHADIDRLTPADIELQFGPDEIREEIETWKSIYGIEERYLAKLLSENDGKCWITQALEEGPERGMSVADVLDYHAWQAQKRPVADCNFLKFAYLQGCHQAGIL